MLTLSGIVFNIISRRTTTAAVTQTSSTSSTSSKIPNDMDEEKATVMFVLGGPGAGKGTQCSNLVKV